MRRFGIATFGLVLAMLAGASLSVGSARAGVVGSARQEGTPAASPAATEAPPPAVTPAPTEAPPPTAAPTDVVTLVAWYALDPSGDVLSLVPVQIDPTLVTSAAPGGQPAGQADLPPDGLPSIDLGDSRFLPFELTEDNPNGQQWTWFQGEEGARPATLVIQIAGIAGTYDGYIGTATFVSRAEGNAGGVLVLALRPPDSEPAPAPTEAPAAEAPADAAPAATPPA